MMRLCIIKPSLFGEQTKDALPPLLFSILKPLTPLDIALTFFDENIEVIPEDFSCDAAAISIDTFTARRGYVLAERFRKRGIPVIIGGIHATLCPEEAGEYADAVIVGEAEDTWSTVITDLRAGVLKARYISANNTALDDVRYDYSVFRGKKYNPIWIVQFSRGCKFACDFCSIHALFGETLRTRPASAVAETIKKLPRKLIFFADDNLFSNRVKIDELLLAIAPLKCHFVCQISIDAARDFELLCRLRRSGCIVVIMGFESLNAENLRQMNKSANLAADYEIAIDNIKRAGLMIYGTFVIGYDADTKETALELAAFATKHKFAIANFNPLIPTPGTKLYKRLENENRLLYDKWWNNPRYCYGDTAFQPKGMTAEELAESCRLARYSFYSFFNIIARLRGVNIKGWLNAFTYLAVNIISRISIRQKQGRRLGE
jgi:radical SAM superfamily enzyme YgiQ (UPF0313 family)